MVPKRDVALIITGAILLALLLLFTKVKEAIQHADERPLRFGPLQIAMFFAIGVWLGFIVLDGATYLLLVLTLGVGLSLVPATAVKSAVLVASSLVSKSELCIYHAEIDWTMAALTRCRDVVAATCGTNFTMSPNAKRYIFWLLAGTIFAEVIHLGIHYILKTH